MHEAGGCASDTLRSLASLAIRGGQSRRRTGWGRCLSRSPAPPSSENTHTAPAPPMVDANQPCQGWNPSGAFGGLATAGIGQPSGGRGRDALLVTTRKRIPQHRLGPTSEAPGAGAPAPEPGAGVGPERLPGASARAGAQTRDERRSREDKSPFAIDARTIHHRPWSCWQTAPAVAVTRAYRASDQDKRPTPGKTLQRESGHATQGARSLGTLPGSPPGAPPS